MSNRNNFIQDHIYDYIIDTSLRDAPYLEQLRRETAELPMGMMQISPDQGQFMALIVKLMSAKRILEVGTFTGYSSLVMARALPADGQIVACDVSEEYTDVAGRYWNEAGVAERIDLRLGPGAETLSALIDEGEAGSFDLAFIDADKPNYGTYYEQCLNLVRAGGLIMIDNVLWGGRPADPAEQEEATVSIRALNRQLHVDERIDFSLLSIGDGLALGRKR